MKWIIWGVGAMLALIALILVVGSALPVEHTATVTRTIPATPETVWTAITDFDAMPSWRTGVDSISRDPNTDGQPAWTEFNGRESLGFAVLEMESPTRLMAQIVGEDLPFGGTWTYDLAPSEEGTTVTITEDGEVYSPLFRFVSRFVMGHDATMKQYLDDLEAYVTP